MKKLFVHKSMTRFVEWERLRLALEHNGSIIFTQSLTEADIVCMCLSDKSEVDEVAKLLHNGLILVILSPDANVFSISQPNVTIIEGGPKLRPILTVLEEAMK